MIWAGVIGVGAMGRHHARVYTEIQGVELVAIADPDENRSGEIARRSKVARYVDYQEMLAREQLDVVSVAVPTRLHHQVALDVIEAGAHLLVEKPLASTVEEASEIMRRARERGLKLSVGHVERFNPAIIELKRRLDKEELGKVFLIHARRLGPFPPRVRDVGVVVDLATHDLDIMRYLIGCEVERVHAETARCIHTDHEDILSGLLRFVDGTIGVLQVNWVTPTKIRELSITGERGMFVVNYLTQDLWFYENSSADSEWESLGILKGVGEGNMVRLRVEKREPLRAEIEDFVESVVSGGEPQARGDDALAALALAKRVAEAARCNMALSGTETSEETGMEAMIEAIQHKTAKLVMIGLGHAGIPVCCLFAGAGFGVVGIDVLQEKVDQINQGICPIRGKEPGLAKLLAQVVRDGRFRASTDYSECQDAQVILIAVETPVDDQTKKPHYEALRLALESLGQNLSRETLVIVESTLAPRTMDTIVKPVLEGVSGLKATEDFHLAHCPERVMPGRLLRNIETMNRVVGGMTLEATRAAIELYRHIVKGDLDPTDCLTAEMVKTTENAYRDVQIAFANEIALVCESVGADVWRVRELLNKCPYRDMHLPGAGVGGHCIPKDPWLLVAEGSEGFVPRLIPAARAVNDGMPLHVAELVVEALQEAKQHFHGAKVAVLGYAYIENSGDIRNSPSEVLVTRLQELGMEPVVHDPYVGEFSRDWRRVVAGADCAVLMVAHDEYRHLDLRELRCIMGRPVLVDARHVFGAKQALEVGFVYRGVGEPSAEGVVRR